VTAEGDRLAAALRYTQGRALSDTVPWQLDWVSSGEYRIGRTGSDWVRIPGGEDDSHTLAPGISASPATTVFFDPWGRPANASGNPLNFDLTITLSDNASNTRTVTIVAETGWIP